MKIKLDENLPVSLAAHLAGSGHDCDTVIGENLAGRPDHDVWLTVQKSGRFFVTQDLDFSDIQEFRPGMHHGLMLVRLRNPSRQVLIERLRSVFLNENVAAWERCFVLLTDRKIRVLTPHQNGK
jgi:predicted nuclease of predicted toxin-antitoxin system